MQAWIVVDVIKDEVILTSRDGIKHSIHVPLIIADGPYIFWLLEYPQVHKVGGLHHTNSFRQQ